MPDKAYFTLISDHMPPEAWPLKPSSAVPGRYDLIDFGKYDIRKVSEFGKRGFLSITPKTCFIAFLTMVEDGVFIGDECGCYVIASVEVTGADSVRLITAAGRAWEIASSDLPLVLPPEQFGLTPWPFWDKPPVEVLPSFMRA